MPDTDDADSGSSAPIQDGVPAPSHRRSLAEMVRREATSGQMIDIEEEPEEDGPPAQSGNNAALLTFNVDPDVGLEIETAWQQASGEEANSGSFTYRVVGPPDVVAFIQRRANGVDLSGAISPPMNVTIHGRAERKAAGIPLECSTFCFCYPLECLSGLYEQLVTTEGRCEPWLFFLLLGGYAYFDAQKQLVRTNAFVLTPARASLNAIGPMTPSSSAIEALRKANRLRNVTLRPLLSAGFARFAWTNRGERPGGAFLLADGSDAPGAGCFVYETQEGVLMLYALVTKDEEAQEARDSIARYKLMVTDRPEADISADGGDAVGGGGGGGGRKKLFLTASAAHIKFLASMGSIAAAANATVEAANKLKKDLAVWRRGPLESWVRTHGINLTLYYAIGCMAYAVFEGWGALDSIYYLTATATTNGDELQPVTGVGKLFSSVYILLGITVVFSGLSPLAMFAIETMQFFLTPAAHALADWTTRSLRWAASAAHGVQHAAPKYGCLSGCLMAAAQLVLKAVEGAGGAVEGSGGGGGGGKGGSPVGAGGAPGRSSSPAGARGGAGRSPPGGGLMRSSSSSGLGAAPASFEDSPAHRTILSALQGYFMALLLVIIVGALGIALAMGVHNYPWIDALYWTVGCMTTAGGDLHADSHLLQALYIIYMPLAAVAALTAARAMIQTSFLREIRLDKYELKVESLLQQEASSRRDANLAMREADFVIAVLRQRKLVDIETIDAIRWHFASVVSKSGDGRKQQSRASGGDYDPIIDAQVVYKHLVRQERVQNISKRPADEPASPLRRKMPPTLSRAASRATGLTAGITTKTEKNVVVYVDMTTADEGFSEWFEHYWTAEVVPPEEPKKADERGYVRLGDERDPLGA